MSSTPDEPTSDADNPGDDGTSIAEAISSESFEQFYEEQEKRANIKDGTGFFNARGAPVNPPRRHNPSRLGSCKRKVAYQELRAPKEDTTPRGIFWFGNRAEEDLAEPFLEHIAREHEEDLFVENGKYINCTVSTSIGGLNLRGETDPVFVDETGTTQHPVEVKTKSEDGWKYFDPDGRGDRRHRWQLLAYMKALEEEEDDVSIEEGTLLYINRGTLEVAPITIEWDEEEWEEATDWMIEETLARSNDELPLAEPEEDWECDLCPYRERCGQGEADVVDVGATGFVPLTEYPREKVEEYLGTYDGSLTPTIAYQHPDLVDETDVYDFQCGDCGSRVAWDSDDIDETTLPDAPDCPSCGSAALEGPDPAVQDHEYIGP